MPESPRSAATAHIGKSVVIKGQLSGSEDLYVDGEVEGTVDLPGQVLTIGPSAKIRANVSARTVVIHGNVSGNVRGADKVELKSSAQLTGDIATKRIAIDDGAFFKGGVDIQKDAAPEAKPTTTTTAPSVNAASAPSTGSTGTGTASTSNANAPKPEPPKQPNLIPTK